jgi:hypothetical protein
MSQLASAAAATTAILLPPPLWGRVGERGKPHNEVDEIRFPDANTKSGCSFFLAIDRDAERVAPLSLTLSHKGRGDTSSDGAKSCP